MQPSSALGVPHPEASTHSTVQDALRQATAKGNPYDEVKLHTHTPIHVDSNVKTFQAGPLIPFTDPRHHVLDTQTHFFLRFLFCLLCVLKTFSFASKSETLPHVVEAYVGLETTS